MKPPLLVPIVKLAHYPADNLPDYATPGSSGVDLLACEDHHLEPGQRFLMPCGICIALPEGFEAQARPRSGLALRHGITLLNSPGTIDSDYRGEIKVILAHLGEKTFEIRRGDRIAQLVIAPVCRVQFDLCDQLGDSERGAGGFGHTGLSPKC